MYFEIVGPITDIETIAVGRGIRQLSRLRRRHGRGRWRENRGAEDLEIRKVYRVLHDKGAAATGYMRVIDESGEDYLYPADYFVSVELPQNAHRPWTANQGLPKLQRPEPPGTYVTRQSEDNGYT